MKKLGVVLFVSLFLSSVFAVGAFAQTGSGSGQSIASVIASGIEAVVDGGKPIIELIVGKYDSSGSLIDADFLFAKFLLLILIMSVLWVPIRALPFIGETRRGVAFLISLIVGLLSIRFLNLDIIKTILLPYSALGIVITAFLPLVLYFVWVEKGLEGYTSLRKVAWIFGLVVFVSLYFVRLPLLNPPEYAVVYLIAGVLCALFFFLDKTIQRAFVSARYENMTALHDSKHRSDILHDYWELKDRFVKEGMPQHDYDRQLVALRERAVRFGIKNLD